MAYDTAVRGGHASAVEEEHWSLWSWPPGSDGTNSSNNNTMRLYMNSSWNGGSRRSQWMWPSNAWVANAASAFGRYAYRRRVNLQMFAVKDVEVALRVAYDGDALYGANVSEGNKPRASATRWQRVPATLSGRYPWKEMRPWMVLRGDRHGRRCGGREELHLHRTVARSRTNRSTSRDRCRGKPWRPCTLWWWRRRRHCRSRPAVCGDREQWASSECGSTGCFVSGTAEYG